MMKKLKVKLIISSICAGFAAVLTVASSLAWFGKFDKLTTDGENGVGGGFLTYFDSGYGTEEKPYVITTAEHYNNLVRLQYEISGWSDKNYYYQFGKAYDKDDKGKDIFGFYAVNEDGEIDKNSFTDTLDLGNIEVRPLGTAEAPFRQHIQGNNLTIENFTVVSEGDYDMGVFGYVDIHDTNPYIQNAYFSNFTIDTSGMLNLNRHESSHGSGVNDFGSVGYLAGHVYNSSVFSNVYVNNCTVKSDKEIPAGIKKRSTYGYYGLVEYANESGDVDVGAGYDFTLNSSDIYTYFRNNYEDIKNLPLHVDGTNYDQEINVQNPVDDGEAIYPVSNSMLYYPADWSQLKLRSTYNLVGDSIQSYSDAPYSGHNYSLSTIGYQPVKKSSKGYEFDICLKNDNETIPLDSSIDKTDITYDNAKLNAGTFDKFNYDNGQAYFYHVKTDNSTCETTFNLSVGDKTQTNALKSGNIIGIKNIDQDKISISGHFFVDGSEVTTIPREAFSDFSVLSVVDRKVLGVDWGHVEIQFKMNSSATYSKYWNPVINLAKGTHHYSFMISIATYNNSEPGYNLYDAQSIRYVDSYTKVHLTGKTLEISNNDVGIGSKKQSVEAANGAWISGSTKNPTTKWSSEDSPVTPLPYVYDESFKKELYVWNEVENPTTGEITRQKVKMSASNELGINFEGFDYKIVEYQYEEYNETTGESQMKTGKKWVTFYNPGLEPEGEPTYIAESEQLTHAEAKAADPSVKGYNKNNLDIVGGGIRFSNTYVTIEPERESRRCAVPASDSIVSYASGNPTNTWYATQYAANSIVLYISNTRAYNENDKMGEINIEYSWSTSILSGSTLGFKHGNNQFTYLDNKFSLQDGDFYDNWSGLNHNVHVILRRGLLKKAAYCALDKNNKILCGYDADGKQVGYKDEVNENDISKFVILLGAHTSLNVDTHIVKIDFSYVAPEGYGGSFGSVEFRDAINTVNSTLFNFYFECPANDKYRIKVIFKNNSYFIFFNYYGSSSKSASLTVNCYLYDYENYKAYLNVDSETEPIADENKQICLTGYQELKIESIVF